MTNDARTPGATPGDTMPQGAPAARDLLLWDVNRFGCPWWCMDGDVPQGHADELAAEDEELPAHSSLDIILRADGLMLRLVQPRFRSEWVTPQEHARRRLTLPVVEVAVDDDYSDLGYHVAFTVPLSAARSLGAALEHLAGAAEHGAFDRGLMQ